MSIPLPIRPIRNSSICIHLPFHALPLPSRAVDTIVVPPLQHQHRVQETEIQRDRDHGRHQPRPNGSDEVADIAERPDEQEGERERRRRRVAVVGQQLGDLNHLFGQ